MIRECVASAPGKLILMGEHAAVFGRPALITAIDLRVNVRFSGTSGSSVELVLEDLGLRDETTWTEIREYSEAARRAWERYRQAPAETAFGVVRGSDPAHVVKVALGEAVRAARPETLPGVVVTVTSDVPIGSGFGSSAAVAVASIAGLLTMLGREPSPELIDRVALETERRQHGFPSGVDHSTVLRGGVVWAEREPTTGSLHLEDLSVAEGQLVPFRILDSGRPVEGTGEVVAAVRGWMEREPKMSGELLLRMEQITRSLRAELVEVGGTPGSVPEYLHDFEECLEALGVVPPAVRRRIEALRAVGAAAKISGAGSLTGEGAGCLLVHRGSSDGQALERALAGCSPVEASLGAPGLSVGGV